MTRDSLRGSLSHLDWFSCVGKELGRGLTMPSISVHSWREAESRCSDAKWEAATNGARGELTGYLTRNYPDKYQSVWNKLVRELRPVVAREVEPALTSKMKLYGFGQVVVDCVKWDVLHALLTEQYLEYSPPTFFLDIFQYYQEGHFPCGWSDDWPQGMLIVY